MRVLRNTTKTLLGVKALRRLLSIFVLTLADGAALVLGLAGAAYTSGGVWASEVVVLAPLLLVLSLQADDDGGCHSE